MLAPDPHTICIGNRGTLPSVEHRVCLVQIPMPLLCQRQFEPWSGIPTCRGTFMQARRTPMLDLGFADRICFVCLPMIASPTAVDRIDPGQADRPAYAFRYRQRVRRRFICGSGPVSAAMKSALRSFQRLGGVPHASRSVASVRVRGFRVRRGDRRDRRDLATIWAWRSPSPWPFWHRLRANGKNRRGFRN